MPRVIMSARIILSLRYEVAVRATVARVHFQRRKCFFARRRYGQVINQKIQGLARQRGKQYALHPVCSGPLRPELSAIVWMLGANVGYEVLWDDAGGARFADQDPLFGQIVEQRRLRTVLRRHLSKI